MTAVNKRQLQAIFSVLLLIGSGYYFLLKALDTRESIDFKYIWLAGKLWSQGISPYGIDFHNAGTVIFYYTNIPTRFYYPPSWYPISVISSNFSFLESSIAWRQVSAIVLVMGLALYVTTFANLNRPLGILRYSVFAAFALAASTTAHALSIGQTSLVVFLGTAVFFHGYALDRRMLIALSLVLLMLKPNIGLPFVTFCLVRKDYFWPAIAAGLASMAMALPAFLLDGPSQLIGQYLGTLGQHNLEGVNYPPCLTGMRNLAFNIFHVDVGASVPMMLACGAAGFISHISERNIIPKYESFLGLISVSAFFIPLHIYDLTLVAPLILSKFRKSVFSTAPIYIGLALLFRPNNFAMLTRFSPSSEALVVGSLVASIGLAFIMIGMIGGMRQVVVDESEPDLSLFRHRGALPGGARGSNE